MARDWTEPKSIEPGTPVALYTGRWNGVGDVKYTTIERTTKTQIITADGGRFSRDHGHRVGKNYSGPIVVDIDDPRVQAVVEAERVADAMHDLSRLHGEVAIGAKVHTKDLTEAIEIARKFKAAADRAVAELETLLPKGPTA